METITSKLATRAEASLVEPGDKRDGRGRKLCQAEHRTDFVRMYRASGLAMAASQGGKPPVKISQSSAAKSNSTWADDHAGTLFSEFRFGFALAWDLLVKP